MHCLSPSSVLMWALMWVLMWIVMCVLMWILMWLGPHVSPYVNPQNPSASSHTPHTTTSALSGLVASPSSACALCVLCVCSVCALLLSGLPGQEAKLNIKSAKKLSKNTTKIIDFRTQHRRFWDPFWYIQFPWPQHATHTQHTLTLRPANDRLFTQKWSPKWTQNLVKWVFIFSSFFDAVLEPCFQRFCLPNGLKMVPKNVSFLRPPTLLKCSK